MCVCVCVCELLSRVQLCNPRDTSLPGSTEFSRREYWRGLSVPPPGDLPDAGIKPRLSALHVDSLPSEPPGKPLGAIAKRQKRYSFRFGNYLEGFRRRKR